MKVKKVWIAGVELIEFICPDCQDRAFAAKRGRDLVAECSCGFESTVAGDLEYGNAEVRIPRVPSRSRMPRKAIYARDGFKCRYCGWGPTNVSANKELAGRADGTVRWNWLSVHHIVPVCQGASSDLDNLVTACWSCHRKFGTGIYPPTERLPRQIPNEGKGEEGYHPFE